jgi:hypothetical protein
MHSVPPILAALVLVAVAVAERQSAPGDLLERAGSYALRYRTAVPALIGEERYEEDLGWRVRGGPPDVAAPRRPGDPSPPLASVTIGGPLRKRTFRSDLLLLALPSDGWLAVRDVFEADGKPVRERRERLTPPFLESLDEGIEEALLVAQLNAHRFPPVPPELIGPVFALRVLEPMNQPRFAYEAKGTKSIGRIRAAEVDWHETARPTWLEDDEGDELPLEGTFWIDPSDGAVLRSVLRARSEAVRAEIETRYSQDRALGVWVPEEMTLDIRHGDEATRAKATYSTFRRVQIKE